MQVQAMADSETLQEGDLQDSDCLCDLAILQALDLLDNCQHQQIEDYLSESPELAQELAWEFAQLDNAVAAIPYGAAIVPMAGDLKQRLFDRIGETLPEETLPEDTLTEDTLPKPKTPAAVDLDAETLAASVAMQPLIVRSEQVRWAPHSVPGVEVGGLYLNKQTREVSCFVKITPGVRYPLHQHAGAEEVLVLEGDLVVGDVVCLAGDYIRSAPGSAHDPITYNGCKLFIRSSLDDRMLQV
jgi:ChrR Cupin-like domain